MHSFTPSILFENNDIVVINKVSGMAVIPGRGIPSGSTLIEILQKIRGIRYLVVHRLDRDTSGVIIFAKNARVHRELNIQFEKRSVEKIYHALVSGIVPDDDVIDKPIKEFGSGRMGISSEGKESITQYSIIEKFNNSSLLEIRPLTGRRHQIRVHLYSIGHPVMGDNLYGKDRPIGGISRLMLHAFKITIALSDLNRVSFTANPDESWNSIIEDVRLNQKTAED